MPRFVVLGKVMTWEMAIYAQFLPGFNSHRPLKFERDEGLLNARSNVELQLPFMWVYSQDVIPSEMDLCH
jgi:hypothetical protein